MYSKYKSFIDKYISLDEQEWNIFKSRFKLIKYKKGDIIHYAGDICDKLLFINSGVARAYIIDENGKDHTWCIYFNDKNAHMTNLYVLDYDSFINKNASRISIEVVEDSEMLCATHDDLEALYSQLRHSDKFGRLMSELAYSFLHNQIIDLHTKNAKERFKDFIDKTPYLLDIVPQYHIATYLGITPQHLSRLKKEFKINLCE